MLAWILVFLAGIAAIFVLALLGAMLRALMGRRGRPRRGPGLFGWLIRLIFFATALTLLLAGAVHALAGPDGSLFGCGVSTFVNAGVDCFGFPGANLVSAWLSLPGQLADAANLALVVLRALPQHIATGFSQMPLPPAMVVQGLVGPLVLLVAWLGFAGLLRDIGSIWGRRPATVDFEDSED